MNSPLRSLLYHPVPDPVTSCQDPPLTPAALRRHPEQLRSGGIRSSSAPPATGRLTDQRRRNPRPVAGFVVRVRKCGLCRLQRHRESRRRQLEPWRRSAHRTPVLCSSLPQDGGARLPARSARGGRPLRRGPTTLGAYGAAARGFLRGPRNVSPTSSGSGPGLRRALAPQLYRRFSGNGPRRPLPPVPVPARSPAAARPAPHRPPPFSRRAPRPEVAAVPFPSPLRLGGGPAPVLLLSPVLLPLPPSLTVGSGCGISPPPPKVSAAPRRHFLLATAPESWAGPLLPRYHRDGYGGQPLPRTATAPRFAHGSRRTSADTSSSPKLSSARALPHSWALGGKPAALHCLPWALARWAEVLPHGPVSRAEV